MSKKIYTVLLAVVLTAGYTQAQFTIGVRAGFNLTNWQNLVGDGGKFKPGFQAGVVGECAISEAFAIQPGILYAMQGYKYEGSKYEGGGVNWKTEETFTLNYIQVPINAQYKLYLGSIKLLLQAGPYIGYAIDGKNKVVDKINGETHESSSKVKLGSGKDKLKPFDFGLGAGAGVQFGNFQAAFGYNHGLMNLSNQDEYTFKNNGFAVTLTYLFRK